VFLRFEISCVFAGSPRYLDLGPKPTKEGVARFETSFVICAGQLTPCELGHFTYDVDTAVPGHGNDGIEGPEVYTDDTHLD